MAGEDAGQRRAAAVHDLDARGLLCPLPVIRTQDRVSGLRPGERLRVRCTDPGTESDIPAWCRINGHRIVDIERGRDELAITLEVGGGRDPSPGASPPRLR